MRHAILLSIFFLLFSCSAQEKKNNNTQEILIAAAPLSNVDKLDFFYKLSESAISLTHQKVIYDPAYFVIPYPNGDVPTGKGVCSDVVIRAYRKLGIDLQKEVHEDMAKHFSAYPHNWGFKAADKNIDHRRVLNLMKFFDRNNAGLKVTTNGADYNYGDIVSWDLGKGITHIGIVIINKSTDGSRNLIVHNIGGGQVEADCLFSFKIIGHYRYNKKST